MQRTDLREVLSLVKEKLSRDAEAACGLFWADARPTTLYAVGEEDGGGDPDATSRYAVGEEDATTFYAVGEEDGRG